MSIPDDIPQDVWYLARRIWAEMLTVNHDAPQKHSFNDCDEIARAILAERERCAKVCEAAAKQFLSPEYATGQPLSSFAERFACDTCAEGIRSGA